MLPLKLTVENFMPYRGAQEPLLLDGLGIACLSGTNGAGKSSLLDAITWALWGRSRAGASADQLVAAGMADMGVQLEFRSHGVDYRVERRHRRRASGGNTTLDFQMRDGGRWRSLNETTVRETTRKLVDTIRLDYETFINSAFLVQGKADLFVSQRPAERKRILGEILNLSVYDGYAQTARKMAQDDRNRQTIARGRIEAIDRELKREEGLKKQAQEITENLSDLSTQLESATKRRDEITAVVTDMQNRQQQLRQAEERIAGLSDEIDGLAKRRQELQDTIAGAEKILSRSDEIEAGWQALEAARSALTDFGNRARAHGELVAERSRLEQAAFELRSVLENQVSEAERRHGELAEQAGQAAALQERLTSLGARREGLEERARGLSERRKERESLYGELEAQRALHSSIKREHDTLDAPMALIAQGELMECPVCGTQLGEHGADRLRRHFESRKNDLLAEMHRIESDGKAMRTRHDGLASGIARDEAALREESSRLDSQAGSIRTQLEQAQEAVQRLPEVSGELDQARTALAALPEESEELRDVRQKIDELGYDADAHTAAQNRETGLRHWEGERRELDTVSARVDADRAAFADVNERWERATTAHGSEQSRAAEFKESVKGLDDAVAESEGAVAVVERLEGQIREEERRETLIEADLQRLDRQREEKARLTEEERASASLASIHDELAYAFGPRGVQALLIETALPELEDDANDLLGRMTNGSMTLRLETQRQTQAGNTVETLEVIISDIQGTRAYEMYSGGEAFRINFALRIALSKLLARRAGSEVPVLFIDEGFGSQDAEGRERLIEAISELWNDPVFHNGLILIITHIDDVRNQFDTRIDVIKTENGSRYNLSG
ncbi:MAG: SMC family ATPase [Dehalococcoidia bacterium]|nr:SMC family ATPase [Dehalococcoidia bacterium]